jgi:phage terminase Nu1 subunit (DNA packaging protein)
MDIGTEKPAIIVEPLEDPFREQLAEILGVSDDTVDELRKQGMPCIRWGRRLVRFRASEAVAWFHDTFGEGEAA